MGRHEGESVMLMPIGRFARASRLSVKSLRNYDESGLLPATLVDPASGYRYYRIEQLARADAIRSLRMVAMPLPQIAEILDGDDPEPLLTSHLATLDRQRDDLDQMSQQLRRRIHLKEYKMSRDVTIKTLPELNVAAYRTRTTPTRIFSDIPAGFDRVMGFLTDAGVDPAGTPFTLYHQAPDADTEGDIALCVPISQPIETSADCQVIEFVQTVTASVVHQGGYDEMGESYGAVAKWIHERGHRIVGPHREVYLNSPAQVDEGDLLTEIHFPSTRKKAPSKYIEQRVSHRSPRGGQHVRLLRSRGAPRVARTASNHPHHRPGNTRSRSHRRDSQVGQPSYLTPQTRSGSTLRIAPTKHGSSSEYAMYFICNTELVERFRMMFGDALSYSNDRALLFRTGAEIPENEVRLCVTMALIYHLAGRSPAGG